MRYMIDHFVGRVVQSNYCVWTITFERNDL